MKSCKIFWSTQSGRAKACARRTVRILREETTLQIDEVGCAFDELSKPFIEIATTTTGDDSTTLLLMFVSTTGDGEHCDSIKETWQTLLQKSLPKTLFATNQQFAMFCLGDRAYGQQFCAAGRKLAVRLLQLGMNRYCDVGYGDDNTPDGGVFRDLDYWLEEQLLPRLEKRLVASKIMDDDGDGVNDPIPYTVEKTRNDCLSHQQQQQQGEEWQQDYFESSYRDYFTQFCPVTAYQYDVQTNRQKIIIPHDNNNTNNPTTTKRKKTPPLYGTVTSNKRITTSDWEQDTRHIQISLKTAQQGDSDDDDVIDSTSPTTTSSSSSSSSSTCTQRPNQAGDVATILPFNSDEIVNKFLDVLPDETKSLADCVLKISIDETRMNNSYARWPKLCTFRGWLKYCADIHSLPEREDLRALSRYCCSVVDDHDHLQGKDQRDKLRSLSETSEAALYADYVLREKRSWADVLYDFDSLRSSGSKLTIEALLVILQPMRPREFSIASSPTATTTHQRVPTSNGEVPLNNGTDTTRGFSIELCVAVVEGKTRLGRSYHGLCSKFLSQSLPSKKEIDGHETTAQSALLVWIRPGSFGKLPLTLLPDTNKFEVPILCVGAGTGIAPMRSLLLERDAVLRASVAASSNNDNGLEDANDDNILVFGCRKQKADYYYEEEWSNLVASKRLRVLTAFSRDQFQKIYVQKVLREADNGTLIVNHLLRRNGAIYIAGGPKMARAVKEEITEALGRELSGGEKAATTFLNKLQRIGKFSVEAWS